MPQPDAEDTGDIRSLTSRVTAGLGGLALGLAAAASVVAVLPAGLPHGLGPAGFPTHYLYSEAIELPAFLLAVVLGTAAAAVADLLHARLTARLRERGDGAADAATLATLATLPFLGLLVVVPSLPFVRATGARPLDDAALLALALAAGLFSWVDGRLGGFRIAPAALGAAAALGAIAALAPEASRLAVAGGVAGGIAGAQLGLRRPHLEGLLLPAGILLALPALRVELRDGGRLVGTQGLTAGGLLAVAALTVLLGVLLLLRGVTTRSRPARVVALGLVLAAGALDLRLDTVDLDPYHEGEYLAPARAVRRGAVPYRDLISMHGLGEDFGKPLAGFALAGGETARGLRLASAWLVPPAVLAALAVAALALGEGALALFALALATCGHGLLGISSRTALADVALALLLLALLRRTPASALAAGAAAVLASVWALDTGGAVLLGGAATAALLPLAAGEGRARFAAAYAGGVAAAGIAYAAVLAGMGALGPFVSDTRALLREYDRAYGRPFLLAVETSPGWLPWLAPAVLVLGGAVLLARLARRRRLGERELVLAALLLTTLVGFKRAIDRSDAEHLLTASHTAWVPLLVLLTPLASTFVRRRLLTAIAVMLLLLDAPAIVAERTGIAGLGRRLAARATEDVTGRSPREAIPRLDLRVSEAQVRHLAPAVLYLEQHTQPGEAVFDFTNHGALAFLADRPALGRFYEVWLAAIPSRQDEVVRALARDPPRVVVWRAGTSFDALDHVDSLVRHWRVAAALNGMAGTLESAGDFLVIRTGTGPPPLDDRVPATLDFGYTPLVWGSAAPAGEPLGEWQAAGAEPGAGPRTAAVLELAGQAPAAVAIEIGAERECHARLSWGGPDLAPGRFSARFTVRGGGEPQVYWIPLAAHPGWAWALGKRVLVLSFEEAPGALRLGTPRAVPAP